MKMLTVDRFWLFYWVWLVLIAGGCSWATTPTPIPTPTPISPPAGKIVFASTKDGYYSREIFMMDTDGSNQINLTQHPSDDYDPAWAPDGRRIVFTSHRYGSGQLLIMDVETREVYRLKGPATAEPHIDWLPTDHDATWSPDGQWIAYTSAALSGAVDIYKIRSDGTEVTQLTDHRAPDYQPTWSPDGKQIAFSSWRVDAPDAGYLSPKEKNIFVMNADGSNVRRFTNDRETENVYPLWSQDGQWIVYTAMREPAYSTWTLIRQEVATPQRQQLLQTTHRNMAADQSPDGAWLVTDGGQMPKQAQKICFVQITGQNYQCLSIPGLYPRWQPSVVRR